MSMNKELIVTQVTSTLVEILDKKDIVITPATRLADLGVDQLDRFELVIRCEDLFEVEISDEQAEKFMTIEDIATFVEMQRSAL